ncbi:hypothetical protein Tco_0919990 [Tanacetum coccineum]
MIADTRNEEKMVLPRIHISNYQERLSSRSVGGFFERCIDVYNRYVDGDFMNSGRPSVSIHIQNFIVSDCHDFIEVVIKCFFMRGPVRELVGLRLPSSRRVSKSSSMISSMTSILKHVSSFNSVKKGLSQDERNFAIFFHSMNNDISGMIVNHGILEQLPSDDAKHDMVFMLGECLDNSLMCVMMGKMNWIDDRMECNDLE